MCKCQFNELCVNTAHKDNASKGKSKLTTTQGQKGTICAENYQTIPLQKLTDNQTTTATVKVTKKNNIRRRVLQDYKAFARRMQLKYVFHGQNKSVHPFSVKFNCELPV